MNEPLAGVRVLDATRLLPGNYCAWLLAALGAEVIKIEDPGAGDYMRTFGAQVEGQGATHHLVNRAKRSLVVDLKRPEGVEVLLRLVDDADVFVESFRPGVTERLGIGREVLTQRRPALVGASLTGFGRVGPLANQAGHDLNYLAVSGLLERIGYADGVPPVVPIPIADLIGGGLTPALGITALVVRARATGQGGWLDASLTEGIAALPNLVVAEILAGASTGGRGRTDHGGALACYAVYPLADGFLAVGAVEVPFWREFCRLLDVDELGPIQYEADRQEEIRGVVSQRLSTLTKTEAEKLFGGSDACATVVASYEEMLSTGFAVDNGLVREDPALPMPVLAPPFVIDGERPKETIRAPFQGEHTREVLLEAGFAPEEIDELVAAGVVGPSA